MKPRLLTRVPRLFSSRGSNLHRFQQGGDGDGKPKPPAMMRSMSIMSNTNIPNILLIVSDDHAAPAISCYGSQMNRTPNIDRIGNEGMRFNNCFCTNAICTPARGSIMTGKYSHKTGIKTLGDTIDQGQEQTSRSCFTATVIRQQLSGNGTSDTAGTATRAGLIIGTCSRCKADTSNLK